MEERLALSNTFLPHPVALSKTVDVKLNLNKVLLALIVACCALGAFMFWLADPLNLKSPADQELIATFHDHRAAFEKLRQMVAEDLHKESYFSESHLSGKLDVTRKQMYKNLLSEIHPGLVVTVDYDKSVRFIFARGGLSAISPGWLKGIEYVSGSYEKKGTISQNLDKANTLLAGVYIRQIEPNWFVLYQRTDD